MKISVIMPVYNSEKFLSKAIDSVLNQEFDDFELVLVDDGATDNSGKICDEYSRQYDNVIVIHKENGGICDARNAGLDKASGDYISFIDNDDIFLPGLLADNYKLANDYDADVVRFERRKVIIKEDGKKYIEKRKGLDYIQGMKDGCAVLEKQQMIKQYTNIRRSGALNGLWNGLYKRSLIEENNIRFDTSIRFGHEDLLFNLQVFAKAQKYVFHNKEYYKYFYRHESSTSAKFNINKVESIWKVACLENEILKQYGKERSERLNNLAGHIFLITEHLNRTNCRLSYKEKKAYLKQYVAYFKSQNMGIKHSLKLIRNRVLKEGIFSMLLNMKMYGLLLGVVKLYCKCTM